MGIEKAKICTLLRLGLDKNDIVTTTDNSNVPNEEVAVV